MNRNLYRLVICLLLIWAGASVFVWYDNRTYTAEQIEAMFQSITSKYGFDIVYEVDENFLSPLVNPAIPAGPSPDSKVIPIRHSVLANYPSILKRALGKYPINVIRKHLSAIHFAGEIDQNGFKYGGSYDPFRRILYIVNEGRKTEGLSIYIVHHEFSSLLLKLHTLLLNPWFEQNPKDFKYLDDIYGNYKTMIKKNIKFKADDVKTNYEKGFVSDYGRTNFENDFNEYSAMIFTYPEKFKKIMNQYPRERGKFLVWLEFYHKIDPIFTEAYLLGED